jgi:hypothetical protein
LTPNVLKKFSRFIPMTFSEPPTSGVAAGRALAATKFGTPPPRASTGRSR